MKEKNTQKRKRKTPVPTYKIITHGEMNRDEFLRASCDMIVHLAMIQREKNKKKSHKGDIPRNDSSITGYIYLKERSKTLTLILL